MSQEPDQVISGKYRLVRRLARGGMGAVWLARHLELQTDVALKFLRAEEGLDPKAEGRFRREARAAAQLKSPHVVHIHDFGIDEGAPYLAMELLQGEDLQECLDRRGALPLGQAIDIAVQAAKGLRAAHDAGVVHRDIKPSNLFLAELSGETVVKVLDFGIAKGGKSDDGETTTRGLVFGSPAYMSPEQARGGQVDARSDLWSLAGVLYKMFTGVSPFEGENASDIVVKLCTEDVAPPSRHLAGLDEAVDAFFRRALSRDPAQRSTSAHEFIAAVTALRPDSDGANLPTAAVRRSSPGRDEETAALATAAPPNEPAPPSESAPRPELRASLAPARPVLSGPRGRWAVRGVLLGLGVLGLGLARGSGDRPPRAEEPLVDRAQIEASVSDDLAEVAPGQDPSPEKNAEGSQDERAGTEEVGVKTVPSDASPPPTGAPPAPSAPSGRRAPAPSPPKRSPVEKPETDPVFGIPVTNP